MTMNGNSGVVTINVVSSIIGITIKDYNAAGLLALTIVKSNVRSPIQSSKTKKLTDQPLESEWS